MSGSRFLNLQVGNSQLFEKTKYVLTVITITAERTKTKYFNAGHAESRGGGRLRKQK